VVVEDLIYVDDLEILIYTTVAPKTSAIFITSAKKSSSSSSSKSEVQVVTLGNVGQEAAGDADEAATAENQSSSSQNYYQLWRGSKGTAMHTLLPFAIFLTAAVSSQLRNTSMSRTTNHRRAPSQLQQTHRCLPRTSFRRAIKAPTRNTRREASRVSRASC